MKINKYKKGVTLVELLVSISILVIVLIVASLFQRDLFFLNSSLQSGLNAQLDTRHLVNVMVTELRKTSPSASGSYPIEFASTTAVTFYSDIDGNGSVKKVRYFLSGSSIKKGVTPPTGNPPVYNAGSESLSTLMDFVISSSTQPIFQYYSSSYDGTSLPLAFPVDVPSIRLIKITVIIDKDPNRSPSQTVVTSNVSLRNLKDNL